MELLEQMFAAQFVPFGHDVPAGAGAGAGGPPITELEERDEAEEAEEAAELPGAGAGAAAAGAGAGGPPTTELLELEEFDDAELHPPGTGLQSSVQIHCPPEQLHPEGIHWPHFGIPSEGGVPEHVSAPKPPKAPGELDPPEDGPPKSEPVAPFVPVAAVPPGGFPPPPIFVRGVTCCVSCCCANCPRNLPGCSCDNTTRPMIAVRNSARTMRRTSPGEGIRFWIVRICLRRGYGLHTRSSCEKIFAPLRISTRVQHKLHIFQVKIR